MLYDCAGVELGKPNSIFSWECQRVWRATRRVSTRIKRKARENVVLLLSGAVHLVTWETWGKQRYSMPFHLCHYWIIQESQTLRTRGLWQGRLIFAGEESGWRTFKQNGHTWALIGCIYGCFTSILWKMMKQLLPEAISRYTKDKSVIGRVINECEIILSQPNRVRWLIYWIRKEQWMMLISHFGRLLHHFS